MTDNEIIKSMQCVIGNDVSCSECTYQKVLPFPSCRMMCAKNALDLINRQKIESNKYRNRVQSQKGEITRLHKKVEELTAELEELKEDYIPKLENGLRRANEIGISQDAEIEKLNAKIAERDKTNFYTMGQLKIAREKLLTAKSEAIKEFADRLKTRIRKDIDEQGMLPLPYTKKAYDTVMIFVDNLVKEMTEVSE